MVNVRGRSKGCSTCRKRRVKCDENSPICNRCKRHGLECDGPRDMAFVIASNRGRAASTTSHTPHHHLSTTKLIPSNEYEIYLCYTRQYHLRRSGPIDLALETIPLDDITAVSIRTSNTPISHQVILSFATVLFGVQHCQANITNCGYSIHGFALARLNAAIARPQCFTSNEIILSVATLAVLESLVPTGTDYFLRHMLGLERLFELRGPKSTCCDGEGLALFKSVRHMIIFAALRTGRKSILAREEWKVALKETCENEEIEEQDLWDVLAERTILKAEKDEMVDKEKKADPESLEKYKDNLKTRAANLLDQLRKWKEQWNSDGRNSYFETSQLVSNSLRGLRQGSGKDNETDTLSTPLTAFDFLNDSAAIMLMLYNTTLICVFQFLIQLELNPDERHEYYAKERSAALEVCRCLPYHIGRRSPLKKHYPPVVHWSIITVSEVLSRCEDVEGKCMAHILESQRENDNGGVVAKGLWAMRNQPRVSSQDSR